jgi:hypothetical protein
MSGACPWHSTTGNIATGAVVSVSPFSPPAGNIATPTPTPVTPVAGNIATQALTPASHLAPLLATLGGVLSQLCRSSGRSLPFGEMSSWGRFRLIAVIAVFGLSAPNQSWLPGADWQLCGDHVIRASTRSGLVAAIHHDPIPTSGYKFVFKIPRMGERP